MKIINNPEKKGMPTQMQGQTLPRIIPLYFNLTLIKNLKAYISENISPNDPQAFMM